MAQPAESGGSEKLRGKLLKLLENALGVDIDDGIMHKPLIIEHDIDISDVLWRIRRELGISIDVKSIDRHELPATIAAIVDCALSRAGHQ